MATLSNEWLMAIFALAAIATWVAGLRLAKATDRIDEHFGLGEALGGMILLSVVGSLPELAITVSAALSGHLDIAAGNLIGGIAMQTLVLVMVDASLRRGRPLSTLAGSLIPALEGLVVVLVVTITAMSAVLPSSAALGRVGIGTVGIVLAWGAGILLLNRVRDRGDLALAVPGGGTGPAAEAEAAGPGKPIGRTLGIFGLASLVTLVAGVLLEQTGNQLADNFGLNGVLFGATVLAAATALPEISTGIAAARLGRYQLVFGDMFGGNAFQVTLFLVADLIAGQPVLSHEGASNAWIAAIGVLMTAVYIVGIILRPERRRGGLGGDSWIAMAIYLAGLWGLLLLSG